MLGARLVTGEGPVSPVHMLVVGGHLLWAHKQQWLSDGCQPGQHMLLLAS
jgi:hypothetical protein